MHCLASTTRCRAIAPPPGCEKSPPGIPLAARNGSVLGLMQSARAGLGLAPLPTAIADGEADLVRVLGPVPALRRIWRVFTPPQMRHQPRVAAFFDFVADEAQALESILTG
jgi:DNA-binding transcriptional LysR family regulator